MPPLGPFNRQETRYQTRAVAVKQVESGEIWGRTPTNGGMEPTVQAYAIPLKINPRTLQKERGIEFTTETAPHPDGSPFEARWYLNHTPGVLRRYQDGEEFACILAAVKNFQP